MTHLNIQQGLNIEVVSTNLIKKLYEAALSVPEPLEGELDAAYMSGNLLVDKSYRALVEYLTNRFDDLHINVTAGYYIPFHDSAVNDVLKNTIGDGIGVLDTLLSSVTNLNNLGLVNNTEITDFREGCLLTDPNISTSAGFVNGCTNLDVLGIPPNFSPFTPGATLNCRPTKIVISDWRKWISLNFNGALNLGDLKHDICTLNSDNSITVVKNIILPEGSNFTSTRNMSGGFYKSTIEEVTLPTSATVLSNFQSSDITTLNFPLNSSLTAIILYCFWGCNKLTLDVSNLPLTITTIGEAAFLKCSSLTGALNLPNLTSLGVGAFQETNITNITDLGSITTIPGWCFNGCGQLTSVVIPNTVTSIGDRAFAYSGVSTLTVPISLKNLVFDGLLNLVTFNANLENWDVFPVFKGCTKLDLGVLYQPLVIYDDKCYHFSPSWTEGEKRTKNQDLIYLPGLQIQFNNSTFYTSNLNYIGWLTLSREGFSLNLLYLKDVKCLDKYAFSGTGTIKLIINNNVPPKIVDHDKNTGTITNGTTVTYTNTTFVTDFQKYPTAIYVPDSAVTTYQSEWPNMANIIYGISALNNGIIYATKADWEVAGKSVGLIAEYMGLSTADLATFVSANNLTYYTPPSS